MSQPCGKEPGPLVPAAEATGAWSWHGLCSFQCALRVSLHISHLTVVYAHKPSKSGHHLALVLLLVDRLLFLYTARFTVIYTPDRWPRSPWISRCVALQCPPSPLVRIVGQGPACRRGCLQASAGSHLLLAEQFFSSHSSLLYQ